MWVKLLVIALDMVFRSPVPLGLGAMVTEPGTEVCTSCT